MENYFKFIFALSMFILTVAYFTYILKEINSTIQEVKSEFGSFKSEFSSLKSEFGSFKSDFSSLKSEFSSFKSDLVEIKNKLKEMSGEEGLEMAKKFSGRIQIWPSSDRNNSFSSGGVVQMWNKSFFLTNMHVVYDTNNTCRRIIKKIELISGNLLKFSFNDILIHPYLDLALIPLKNFTGGSEISREPLSLMDYLVGVSYREKGEVGLHGRVLEKGGNYSSSDIGGTHGFSGTNYFTKGKVTAVHVGQGNFTHAFKNEIYHEKTFNYSYEWISEYVQYHSRNPRTVIVEAYRIYEINMGNLLTKAKRSKLCLNKNRRRN